MMSAKKMTMGVIIGNRGFFPDQLAKSGREEMIQALAKAGMDSVVLGPEESKHGAVETHEEAKRCAALFQKKSRPVGWRHCLAAQFRRRTRNRRYHATGETRCSSPSASDA